jgi:Predicted transmembrane protein 161AB.
LERYLYPTDEELRALAGVPKDKGKGKKGGRNVENGKTAETFHIPRNLDIQV